MSARPRIATAVSLALLVGLAVGSAAAEEKPLISVGDFWTYATNTTARDGFYFVGPITFTVTARESRVVEGSSLEVYRVFVSGEGVAQGIVETSFGPVPATGSWRIAGEEALTTDDLKLVSSVLDLRANGTLHLEPIPQDFLLRFQNTTTFVILEDTWQFPVDVGDSGSVRARANWTEDITIQFGLSTDTTRSNGTAIQDIDFHADARETVQTPLGPFDALRLRETRADGSHDLLFYASAAGNNVRTEAYDASGRLIGTTVLESYRSQATEPARVLGLTAVQWAIVGAAATAAGIGFVLLWRRRGARRPPPAPPPPT